MNGVPFTYLDYNATAPVKPTVRAAMLHALEEGGNPSSIHAQGRKARARLEAAREAVAALVGACAEDVVFTSGGTEANNLALFGLARANGINTLLISAVEHASVRDAARASGLTWREIAVTADGQINLACLDEALAQDGKPLLALMLANNETGVVQPLAQAAQRVHAKGGLVHCDAVQAIGKIPVSIHEIDVDSLAISAHKFGGPQGAGALVFRQSCDLSALALGGGQERGRRAGTENLPAIAGFAEAAKLAIEELPFFSRLRSERDSFEAKLMAAAPEVEIFGLHSPRLPNTSAFALNGFAAETALMALDLAGVAVSSGSACSSGKVGTSHVLAAMGIKPELARCALRVSTGWASRPEHLDHFITVWQTSRMRTQQAAPLSVAS